MVGGYAAEEKGIEVLWHSGAVMPDDLCCFEPDLKEQDLYTCNRSLSVKSSTAFKFLVPEWQRLNRDGDLITFPVSNRQSVFAQPGIVSFQFFVIDPMIMCEANQVVDALLDFYVS